MTVTIVAKRMGRRKQNCPQRTGITGADALVSSSAGADDGVEENGGGHGHDDDDAGAGGGAPSVASDSASVSGSSDRDSKEVTLPTLEALEPEAMAAATPASMAAAAMAMAANGHGLPSSPLKSLLGGDEALANMLKNPLLNPALLSLNPSSLYAMQLAQLQAQLLSQSAGLQQLTAGAKKAGEAAAAEAAASSRKRKLDAEAAERHEDVLNLSRKSPRTTFSLEGHLRAESPLDLSGSKRPGQASPDMSMAKLDDAMAAAAAAAAGKFNLPAWATHFPLMNPFLAGSVTPEAMSRFPMQSMASLASLAAASSSGSSSAAMPASASMTSPSGFDKNPLERMSEIAKTGGAARDASPLRPSMGGPRHSAWQSQWLNRGPEATKDIFKCVWCKDSFSTLAALTTHMKETKHFGSALPPAPQTSPQGMSSRAGPGAGSPQMHVRPPQMTPPTPPPPSSSATSSKSRDILKEHLPMPRKLVRGQDVWLGRGEQQTKDILKCMWCGESFRTLDLMTKHMQETKHYTKVISQEQLISWKSAETSTTPQNHVNAVLTCKVCDQAFASLKDLSDHMVKNNHYKEHMRPPSADITAGRGPPAGGPLAAVAPPPVGVGRGGAGPAGLLAAAAAGGPPAAAAAAAGGLAPSNVTAKEKRKKSLPVRKLLELERAQAELTGQLKSHSDEASGKISCEKCCEKIPMHLFVDHIRQCVGPMPISRGMGLDSRGLQAMRTPSLSPPSRGEKTAQSPGADEPAADDQPKSILGSLEKMVQKNFGIKRKPGPENSMSILQRLGIDEGVDYSKPLVDPMALFRPPAISPSSSSGLLSASSMFSLMSPAAAAAAMRSMAASADSPLLQLGSLGRSSTRSDSECSGSASPDRPRADHASTKSESPVKSPAADADDVKSPLERSTKEAGEDCEDTPRSGRSSVHDEKRETASDAGDATEKEGEADALEGEGSPSRASSASPAASRSESADKSANGCAADQGKDKKSHPLAALQMLCDKTEKTPKSSSSAGAAASSPYGGPSDPGAILAFSWACNQAVVNDSLLKCPFCDTPFISKGAYRHHLSKMHFVKDGASPDPKMFMNKTPEKSPSTPTDAGSKEENAQSKFQKYSQLAKQLSCSGQP